MIGIVAASLAVAFGTFLVCARLLAAERRGREREAKQWERERAALLDRLAFMADKPWNPAPARAPSEPAEPRDADEELAVW